MRLEPIFLFLCSFIWKCIGAPPKDVGKERNLWRINYTAEEDQFIVDELSNILDDTIQLYNQDVWETLAERYKEKFKHGNPGFVSERSAKSLLGHFRNILIHNYPHHEVQVPRELIEKIVRRTYVHKGRAKWSPWTQEENDLIIEELSKPTCTNFYSPATYEAIRAEHDKKREAGIDGFHNVRNYDSIRSHLCKMRRKGQIPKEILENLEKNRRAIWQLYNKYENDLIIEELSKPSCTSLFSKATIEAIRAEHDKRRIAGTHGFKHVRSADAIRGHLGFMKDNGLLPNELLEKLQKHHKGASSSKSLPQNEEKDLQVSNEGQDDWIADMIEELQNDVDFDIDFSKLGSIDDK